jgi:decaprenylphospho-beta-D-erythro-pentofuranosid-2-ulose 2-reductase
MEILMDNALGQPQSIVLLGGTSDIGVEIVRQLISPSARRVVLACRDTAAGEERAASLRTDSAAADLDIDVVAFDATKPQTHADLAAGWAGSHGDVDVVVVAFGVLGSGETSRDPVAAAAVAAVNFTGAVSATIAAANVLRAQGHGSLVILSSVAGERVRKANPVYGATKAGIDAFAQAMSDGLVGDGVHVLIVRPGFVHTAMTEGMKAAPFATTAPKVAAATVKGLRNGKRVVCVPGVLRYVFTVLRHLPTPIWRKLPLD